MTEATEAKARLKTKVKLEWQMLEAGWMVAMA